MRTLNMTESNSDCAFIGDAYQRKGTSNPAYVEEIGSTKQVHDLYVTTKRKISSSSSSSSSSLSPSLRFSSMEIDEAEREEEKVLKASHFPPSFTSARKARVCVYEEEDRRRAKVEASKLASLTGRTAFKKNVMHTPRGGGKDGVKREGGRHVEDRESSDEDERIEDSSMRMKKKTRHSDTVAEGGKEIGKEGDEGGNCEEESEEWIDGRKFVVAASPPTASKSTVAVVDLTLSDGEDERTEGGKVEGKERGEKEERWSGKEREKEADRETGREGGKRSRCDVDKKKGTNTEEDEEDDVIFIEDDKAKERAKEKAKDVGKLPVKKTPLQFFSQTSKSSSSSIPSSSASAVHVADGPAIHDFDFSRNRNKVLFSKLQEKESARAEICDRLFPPSTMSRESMEERYGSAAIFDIRQSDGNGKQIYWVSKNNVPFYMIPCIASQLKVQFVFTAPSLNSFLPPFLHSSSLLSFFPLLISHFFLFPPLPLLTLY